MTGNQCLSGFCPGDDGVCCDSACGSGCEACVSGKTGAPNGTCASITAGIDPEGECSDVGAANCGANGSGCDGNGACRMYPAGTQCGAATCAAGNATAASQCTGNGSCTAGESTLCAPYRCAGNGCASTCANNAGCIAGYECQGGQCVQPGCGGAGPGTTPLDTQEQAFVGLINNYRASNGLSALTPCTSLNRAAQGHSEWMLAQMNLSHTGANGSSMVDRACDACYDQACPLQTSMGENILYNFNGNAQSAFDQWRNSPPHNANMLNSSFTMIGVGRAVSSGPIYWTNKFAGANEASCN